MKENWYTKKIAKNTNTSPDILRKILEQGKDDDVSWHAAQNLNCPPDVLKTVLEEGKNDTVSQCAAQNPNCPPELLKMVLERGKDDYVSMYAAGNNNCPSDAKIKWKKAIGQELTQEEEIIQSTLNAEILEVF